MTLKGFAFSKVSGSDSVISGNCTLQLFGLCMGTIGRLIINSSSIMSWIFSSGLLTIRGSYRPGSLAASSSVCTIPRVKSLIISYSKVSIQRWHCKLTGLWIWACRLRMPSWSMPKVMSTCASPSLLARLSFSLSIFFNGMRPCNWVAWSAKRMGSNFSGR